MFSHVPTEITDELVLSNKTNDIDLITECIKRTRFRLIVHSIIYYKLNENIISDHEYDALCLKLVYLQRDYAFIASTMNFHDDVFKDWTGDTGFQLAELPYYGLALDLVVQHRKRNFNK